MFVLRSDQLIHPGSTQDYDAYQRRSLDISSQQPGFLRELRLVYLGNTARRVMYQMWQEQADRVAYSRSDRWFGLPEGLLAGPAESGFYTGFAAAQDAHIETGQYVLERHLRASNGQQAELEAIEQGLCDMAKGQRGFVGRFCLKFLGNDTSYLRVSIWQSWEELQAWVATPEYVSENEAILGCVVWTSADRYEIGAAAVGR
jgi:heme-degrading monooxygenase HmoA